MEVYQVISSEEGSEEKESETPAATPSKQLLLAAIASERPPHFAADHPFMFVVIDTHSKVLLFVGHVTKPR